MPLSKIILARHASRQDKVDPFWIYSALNPYDTPLSSLGFEQASITGRFTAHHLGAELNQNTTRMNDSNKSLVYIHSSPYLRCAQTAGGIASQLPRQRPADGCKHAKPKVRFDSSLGEWLTSNYFDTIDPPPEDDFTIINGSKLWLSLNYGYRAFFAIDDTWSSKKLGTSGKFEESWARMNQRFATYTKNLIQHYSDYAEDISVVIVTHGVGCNAILGHLTKSAFYTEVPLSSVSVATLNPQTADWDLHLVSEAGHLTSPDYENDNNKVNNNREDNNEPTTSSRNHIDYDGNTEPLKAPWSMTAPQLSLSSASSSSSLSSLSSSAGVLGKPITTTYASSMSPNHAEYAWIGSTNPTKLSPSSTAATARFRKRLQAHNGYSYGLDSPDNAMESATTGANIRRVGTDRHESYAVDHAIGTHNLWLPFGQSP
ncbi:phosphoglycerate mutase-like protein [Nadsonia fulvescens var. elongata DSM 6958]|uniref:Phosphoglycerate mutase-like protein n=1 Tax=Nadsonia fulvescens var. elongata DSM 6958 TaxID=857566 RepID=A0A1E3PT13_9ASCO|nr:phosphoglycerate mutase-like protein [Nadsonia fulvescens var. elongata DSM 6958]